MEIKDAVKLAEQNDEVKELLSEKGFLCAAHTMIRKANSIEEWKLSFYNPKSKQIMTVTVANDAASVDSLDKPLREVKNKIDVAAVKVSALDALKTATEEERKKFKAPFMKVLFSLQEGFFSAIFFTAAFDTISITIDSKTGKVKEAVQDSLLGK